ncbi:hypothetical protein FGKAn22_06620 [Ferrigenium kumadai]|uniref:DUF7931 domain-containing protein n=1 Tax=Ferrigenium kumadai TaxID=1682490 RepID=A0AAN1T072_9PROT|nr:hypothetical protein [Ferrigenium kumadai]BBI98969.1 hypothetical protein FGKAn22_06620 [Ferrigenium kumadai]
MSEGTLQHNKLDGIADYTGALDGLCKLAEHNLYLFEKNYDGLGFNSEARYETLRRFLLASPNNRLYVLAHDTRYLSTLCPRMTMLLRQFGGSMFIHQTPPHLQQISEPFAVADDSHYVRRFHFDDPRGILALNDPENARALKSRFLEIWEASHSAVSATKLGL